VHVHRDVVIIIIILLQRDQRAKFSPGGGGGQGDPQSNREYTRFATELPVLAAALRFKR
jgi:preprotein translocase subunit SecG